MGVLPALLTIHDAVDSPRNRRENAYVSVHRPTHSELRPTRDSGKLLCQEV
jgi:hypothetical protein